MAPLHRPSIARALRRPAGALLLLVLPIACLVGCSSNTVLVLPPPWPGPRPEVKLVGEPDAARLEEQHRISAVLLRLGPDLARWGEFRQRVVVHVYPTHEALEERAGVEDYPWLRAWSWGTEIALQSPRTWDANRPEIPDAELEELLAHEMTHALMYQLIDKEGEPPRPEPPLWFREGMASVTAGQGHRRLPPAQLARWVARHPGVALLRPSSDTYRTEKEAVYGAAHRTFELLLLTGGERGVRDLLHYASEGRTFGQAFSLAIGKRLDQFEQESMRIGFEPALAQKTAASRGAGGP